jgi:archaemetzincin
MNICTRSLIILFFFTFVVVRLCPASPKITIALQPFKDFDTSLISKVKKGITDFYGDINMVIQPITELPKMAWYPPRNRYRAERLLVFLDSIRNDSCTKILGLTSKDISTAKGEYVDWGIFGLGELGGPTCVVSSFRLRKGSPNQAIFLRRLLEVINHELGHTFGLDHCPHTGCIMEDAGGTIKTVDNSSGRLCDACKKLLQINLKMY